MSKQTAVEWFWNQLPDILPFSLDTETAVKLHEAKEQALQMAREQIEEAYYDGTDLDSMFTTSSEYYDQTYGKEASNEG